MFCRGGGRARFHAAGSTLLVDAWAGMATHGNSCSWALLSPTCSRSTSSSCCAASSCSFDALLPRLAPSDPDMDLPSPPRSGTLLPAGPERGATGAGPRRTAGIVELGMAEDARENCTGSEWGSVLAQCLQGGRLFPRHQQAHAPAPRPHLLAISGSAALAAGHRVVVVDGQPARDLLPVAVEPLHELLVVLPLALAERAGVEGLRAEGALGGCAR